MTRAEDLVRATTRAIASTVRDVPPLRLAPAETRAPSPAFAPPTRRARRLRGWLAPVTAAAVVLAVAVSLVIIRDIPNGRVVPPASPASPVSVPAYYVAISAPAHDVRRAQRPRGRRHVHRRQLATVAPPKGTMFGGVTAAADDRTFVVDTLPDSYADARPAARTWYLLRISPGSVVARPADPAAHPGDRSGTNVTAIALSPDPGPSSRWRPAAGRPERPERADLPCGSTRSPTGAVLRSTRFRPGLLRDLVHW